MAQKWGVKKSSIPWIPALDYKLEYIKGKGVLKFLLNATRTQGSSSDLLE